MRSLLEGLITMGCFAAVGGFIARFAARSESLWVLVPFAYIALHIIFAGIIVVPLAILLAALNIDAPPHSFLISLCAVVVAPAIAAMFLIVLVVCHYPDAGYTRGLATLGAVASPFVLVGVVGTAIESFATREKDRITKP